MTKTNGEAIVLTLNSGSSSLKFGLYHADTSRTEMLLTGEADSIGEDAGQIRARDARGKALTTSTVAIRDQRDAIVQIERLRADSKLSSPTAVGHRIVHGGPKLRRHCIIDDEVLQQLDAAVPFAPLHLPPALAIIRSARELFPNLPHMACFDTTLPRRFAGCRARSIASKRTARGWNPALWLSRPFLRVDPASAWQRCAGSCRDRTSGQRRQRDRG